MRKILGFLRFCYAWLKWRWQIARLEVNDGFIAIPVQAPPGTYLDVLSFDEDGFTLILTENYPEDVEDADETPF